MSGKNPDLPTRSALSGLYTKRPRPTKGQRFADLVVQTGRDPVRERAGKTSSKIRFNLLRTTTGDVRLGEAVVLPDTITVTKVREFDPAREFRFAKAKAKRRNALRDILSRTAEAPAAPPAPAVDPRLGEVIDPAVVAGSAFVAEVEARLAALPPGFTDWTRAGRRWPDEVPELLGPLD